MNNVILFFVILSVLFSFSFGMILYLIKLLVRNKSDRQDLNRDSTVHNTMSSKDKRDPKKVLEGGDELD